MKVVTEGVIRDTFTLSESLYYSRGNDSFKVRSPREMYPFIKRKSCFALVSEMKTQMPLTRIKLRIFSTYQIKCDLQNLLALCIPCIMFQYVDKPTRCNNSYKLSLLSIS